MRYIYKDIALDGRTISTLHMQSPLLEQWIVASRNHNELDHQITSYHQMRGTPNVVYHLNHGL